MRVALPEGRTGARAPEARSSMSVAAEARATLAARERRVVPRASSSVAHRSIVGLMSGTSLDGADAALVDFSAGCRARSRSPRVPFSDALRERILALSEPGTDSLDARGAASHRAGRALRARRRERARRRRSRRARQIAAIGCHGQTVRHRPERGLHDPAERPRAARGADRHRRGRRLPQPRHGRRRAGRAARARVPRRGVPPPERSRAVVNIGGISNVTWLAGGGRTLGFDCGPGNVLLDGWARRHLGARFDEDGRLGRRRAQPIPTLLARLMARALPRRAAAEEHGARALPPGLARGPPRPRHVAPAGCAGHAARASRRRRSCDAIDRFCARQRTRSSSAAAARATARWSTRIAALACRRPVAPTDALGVPTGHVEAMAFAWLAMKCVRREPVDLTAVTGARAPRILGAVYPPENEKGSRGSPSMPPACAGSEPQARERRPAAAGRASRSDS